MTEEYQPTMVTWKRYALLEPDAQKKVRETLARQARDQLVNPVLAKRYYILADILLNDDIVAYAYDPEMLTILHLVLESIA